MILYVSCVFHVYFTLLYLCAGDLQITNDSTLMFGIVYIYAAALLFAIAFNNCVEDLIFATARRKLRTSLQQMSIERFQADWLRAALQPVPTTLSNKSDATEQLSSDVDKSAVFPPASTTCSPVIDGNADNRHSFPAEYTAIVHPAVEPGADESDVIQGVCGEDRFVLLTLIELGVLDRERDVLPLRQVT